MSIQKEWQKKASKGIKDSRKRVADVQMSGHRFSIEKYGMGPVGDIGPRRLGMPIAWGKPKGNNDNRK